ncbi:GNAT family N-acetyltransferase [Sorangium sp. So ce185]|uniref:GNAT family N-acetyltransferase n=1 Tax=Sorangium sp. So ce185 TaxID=3133287 RepID=UPI003F6126FE
MQLVLQKVTQKEIRSEVLRERSRIGGATKFTELFVALLDSEQVGLLSIDFRPKSEPLELYEIFVTRECRQHGVGSFLLEQAEALGRARGYSSVILKPHPLDTDQDKTSLVRWYRKRGYAMHKSIDDMMEKML